MIQYNYYFLQTCTFYLYHISRKFNCKHTQTTAKQLNKLSKYQETQKTYKNVIKSAPFKQVCITLLTCSIVTSAILSLPCFPTNSLTIFRCSGITTDRTSFKFYSNKQTHIQQVSKEHI